MFDIFSNKRSTAKANNRISQSQALTANVGRRAANMRAAAEGTLARWMQSVNNGRILKEGGEVIAAATTNFNRSVESETNRRFAADIASAEQEGAAAAAQAFSGTSGTVAQNVNAATALRDQLAAQQAGDRLDQVTFDQRKRVASIASQVIGGMDSSVLLDNLDFNQDAAVTEAELSRSNVAIQAMVGTAATWIGAGGMASLGAGSAQRTPQRARNSSGGVETEFNERRFSYQLEQEAAAASFRFQDDDFDYLR